MTTHYGPIGLRHIILAALMLVTFGVGIQPSGSAAGIVKIQRPSIGEIVVDSYNCETGELAFHAPVTALVAVDPSTTFISDYPLVYAFGAHYGPEISPQISAGVFVWTPTAEQSPFSGTVQLEGFVPPTHDGRAVTRIVIQILVGNGDYLEEPADSSVTSYATDCGSPDNDLVSQLIAKLKQILLDILSA